MRNILLSISAMILLLITVLLASTILETNGNSSMQKNESISKPLDIAGSDTGNTRDNHDNIFSSHLPLVLIETDGQTITKEEIIWSKIAVIDNLRGKNYIDDEYDFQTASTLKYRGSSSLAFDKKQYRLEFFKESEGTKKNDISVMGMSKDEDWVLNGPFLDRTLMRNRLFYDVSREIMDWAPDSRYCEVFLDGEYQGVYLMIESIKASDSRIDLKDFSLLDGETAYILQRERRGAENNVIGTFGSYAGKTGHELSIKYPTTQKIMETQKEWIRKDISEFERVLYSNQFDDKENGYSKYIDVESFVDYYIINEFAMNKDAGFLSTFVYKDVGGKLKKTVWDFNNILDNYSGKEISSNEFCIENNNWYKRLIQDRSFTEKVVTRYHELRKDVLSDEYLLKTIDDLVLHLGDAVDRNFEVWGYTFNKSLLVGDRDPTNYDEAIKQMKKEIVDRGKFLDENIETLYQFVIN